MTGACFIGALGALPALAQKAENDGIDEVTVTAQKRSENLQDVPVAVTAVSANALEMGGVANITDLNNVAPGVNFTTALGAYAQPVIRGVGTASHGPGVENPVATYIDGVYMASATSALLSLSDVDQLSVLKGPQGTLFGRNATGGLIQITTTPPTHDFYGDAQATFGNVGTYGQSLFVNGGLTSTIAANFAISHDDQYEGFGHNLTTGQYVGTSRDIAMRGKILWTINDTTDLLISADYNKRESADPALHPLTTTLGSAAAVNFVNPGHLDPTLTNAWDVVGTQPDLNFEGSGESVTLKHDFGGIQLQNIAAYRTDTTSAVFNPALTTTPYLTLAYTQRDSQASDELQLLSTGDQRFSWVAGLFAMRAESKYDPFTSYFMNADNPVTGAFTASSFIPAGVVLASNLYSSSNLTSYAAFGQGTFKIDDATNLTGGLRYSVDRRTLDESESSYPPVAPEDSSATFAKPSWRLSLDHRFSPELMAYASYNRGFRSGTFVPDILPTQKLEPETLDAYEVGVKSDLFNKKLRIDASAFYYDYKNRQVLEIVNGAEQVFDAKSATSYGMDLDVTAKLAEGLTLTGGASAIHTEYTNFQNALAYTPISPFGLMFALPFASESTTTNYNANGKAIESVPAWTVNLTPAYRFSNSAGNFMLSTTLYHSDGWYSAPDNRLKQGAYSTVAAGFNWTPSFADNLTVKLWGRNLTNTVYALQLEESSYGDNRDTAPGRTFGATVRVDF
jgi:iron complex outermembrane receptor protein